VTTTFMLGETKPMNNIVVADADSLIALAYKDDSNHQRAKKTAEWLLSRGYQIVYPNTAILEAITTLKRALSLPDKAHLIARQYVQGAFLVQYVDEDIQKAASKLFEEKAVSKKNTIFDSIVAITAQELNAHYIFSFDSWYPKLGFQLAENK